jgi:hypothetical protein
VEVDPALHVPSLDDVTAGAAELIGVPIVVITPVGLLASHHRPLSRFLTSKTIGWLQAVYGGDVDDRAAGVVGAA